MKRDDALMFTCSLVEYIGRERKLRRSEVARHLGREGLSRVYRHADVLHSEPIEHVADEYARLSQMPTGDFDNVSTCKYDVPSYWAIGEVYERLVQDVSENDPVEGMMDVFTSWIDDAISNYNSDFFYQPRDYLKECYRAGMVL